MTNRALGIIGGIALALFALPAAIAAQEEPPRPEEEHPPRPARIQQESPAAILREIEAKMIEAEKLLARATGEPEASHTMQEVLRKLDDLLKNAGTKQQEILDALQRLEDQAVPVPSGSGGSGQEQQRPQDRGQQEPRPDREDRSLQQLDPGNSKETTDGKDRKRPEKQQSGQTKPPDTPKEKADHPDSYERWGNLPEKLREQLQQGNFESFPPQYRELLERFYKRLGDAEKSDKR
jgi:hypothetical protein